MRPQSDLKKMKKILSVLFLFCALTGLAQSPLLTTKWNQDYPYNMLCPADPLEDYAHSYTGCPATAMGQIINYLRTTQNTRFDDNDDYYANYASRQFHIDDDWETYQFPSFPQLNGLLDSVDATFQRGEELSDSLVAAVIFPAAWPASRSLPHRLIMVPAPFMWIRRMRPTNGLALRTVSCSVTPTPSCMPR